jgi:23S rRNA pseudouridine1911/1915/1917 synthase
MSTPSSHEEFLLTVGPSQSGWRLDVFLVSQLKDLSRSRVRTLLDEGQVTAEFPIKEIKPSFSVAEGQVFRVKIPPPPPTSIEAQPIDLDILFEDEDFLVINKPAGLVVHPGAGNPDKTLLNALVAHCPDIVGVGGVQRPGLVHRIDKDTSGLMAVAKTPRAYKSLVRQLAGRKLSREYLAIVKGHLNEKGRVEAPIGRHPSSRNRMAVRAETGKKAMTHFVTLQANDTASFLYLKLETGRTHQIRVHMEFIKHPILGDGVYGEDSGQAPRQMLHAFRLSLKHPVTGEIQSFTAPPPPDFLDCLRGIQFHPMDWEQLKWGSETSKEVV